MRPLKVSVDASAVPPQPAGAGRYTLGLLGALDVREDLDLAIVARKGAGQMLRDVAPGAEVLEWVPQARPARLAYERLRLGSRLSRLGVDVHHGPHYTMPDRCSMPVVVTIHDLTFFDHPELHEAAKVHFFRRAIARAVERAAVLICVSETTARHLEQRFHPRQPVVVAPHGIDHERFHPGLDGRDVAALESIGLQPGASRIVQVGTLEPRKAPLELVAAFEQLAPTHPNLELVFAGQRGWGLEDFDRAVANSPARERIRVLGYVTDEQLVALLRSASVASFASIDEGFGLPALEALACGTVVVTAEGSVMAELCGDAPYLARAGDVPSLVRALSAALAVEEPERERRRSLGLARAGRFTWAATAERHVEAYRRAAEGTSP
jgi:glycosyltransferase involved in cell wall biosynthesis